jgi:hypothetical protein
VGVAPGDTDLQSNQSVPTTTTGGGQSGGRAGGVLREIGRHLTALGPFALVFGIYSILLDHLPNQWFEQSWLRYLFAVLAALCVGAALRWLVQRPGVQRVVGPSTSIALLPGPRQPQAVESVSAKAILEGTRTRLLADLRTSKQPGFELFGWSQYIGNDVPPSAIGTAYGLRTALALDIRDARLDRRKLVDTVIALQRPAGGWMARSQRDVGRPEVTAWVLAAASGGLDRQTRDNVVGQLERMMSVQTDPVGMNSVLVLSSALSALVEVNPHSAKVEELTKILLDAAVDQHSDSGPRKVAWRMTTTASGPPSVPHTARAICALHKVHSAQVHVGSSLDEIIDASLDWLNDASDLDLVNELLRRQVPQSGGSGDAMDMIYVGHFTPAWVARALMSRRVESHLARLRLCVRAVLTYQERGVWRWKDQQLEPIWMTYQGAVVLRDYSMLNLPWPP